MTYAFMKPAKVDVSDAIPLSPSFPHSKMPKQPHKERTEEQVKKAQEEFENRATNHYYAEWLWFPYSNRLWSNTWDTPDDKSNVKGYRSKKQIVLQWLQVVAMEAMQKTQVVGIVKTSTICKNL